MLYDVKDNIMSNKGTTSCTPTIEQLDAIRQYANWAGGDWKERLASDWMRSGSEWSGEWAHLQQLRNTLGPAWLAKFERGELR